MGTGKWWRVPIENGKVFLGHERWVTGLRPPWAINNSPIDDWFIRASLLYSSIPPQANIKYQYCVDSFFLKEVGHRILDHYRSLFSASVSNCFNLLYLKSYALCPRHLLASRGCHLGGTSGAPWGPFWHLGRDHAGGSWEQQDGFEMVVYTILFDFGVILGPECISFFSSTQTAYYFCFQGLFPGHCSTDFCIEISTPGTPKSGFSHGKYCKNWLFMDIVCNECRDRFLLFGSLGDSFSDFLSLESRLGNRRFFVDIRAPEFGMWRRESTGYLGPL